MIPLLAKRSEQKIQEVTRCKITGQIAEMWVSE